MLPKHVLFRLAKPDLSSIVKDFVSIRGTNNPYRSRVFHLSEANESLSGFYSAFVLVKLFSPKVRNVLDSE